MPAPEGEAMMLCPECAAICEPEETVTLYDCQGCSTIFDQDGSDDGCSNRCPDCHKFASKLTENGCPECTEGEMESCTAQEISGEWVLLDGAPDDPEKAMAAAEVLADEAADKDFAAAQADQDAAAEAGHGDEATSDETD